MPMRFAEMASLLLPLFLSLGSNSPKVSDVSQRPTVGWEYSTRVDFTVNAFKKSSEINAETFST